MHVDNKLVGGSRGKGWSNLLLGPRALGGLGSLSLSPAGWLGFSFLSPAVQVVHLRIRVGSAVHLTLTVGLVLYPFL